MNKSHIYNYKIAKPILHFISAIIKWHSSIFISVTSTTETQGKFNILKPNISLLTFKKQPVNASQ